jgi:hypothetical protein
VERQPGKLFRGEGEGNEPGAGEGGTQMVMEWSQTWVPGEPVDG